MDPVISKLAVLPPELRALIESDDVLTIIDEVGEQYDIPEGWRGELTRATNKILAGVMEPSEFVPFMEEQFFFSQEEALKVALAINDKLFSKVKPQLASLHHIEDTKIARRINVPRKPRQSGIAPETELIPQPASPAPVAPSADVAPAERIAPAYSMNNTPDIPIEGAVPSPLTAAFAQPPVMPSTLPPSAAQVAYGIPGVVGSIPGVNAPYIVPPPSQNPPALPVLPEMPPPAPQYYGIPQATMSVPTPQQPIQVPVNTSLQNKLGNMRNVNPDPYRESF